MIPELLVVDVFEIDTSALIEKNVSFLTHDLVLVRGLAHLVVIEMVPVIVIESKSGVMPG